VALCLVVFIRRISVTGGGVFVELMAVGNTDNGVNCDATWSRVMTKKKECEAVVLAILDATDSEPIASTIACLRV
jgi:hypothetical protein